MIKKRINKINHHCKIVSFMNMKGGVGKTTLCVNLADAVSSLENKKILLVDFDPQANSTQYILDAEKYTSLLENERTIYKLYKPFVEDNENYSIVVNDNEDEIENENEDEDEDCSGQIIYKVNKKFHLVPGDLKMTKISQNNDTTLALQLDNFIKKVKIDYDYIFIDCPPTQSIYTQSALMATNFYVIPVKPDYLSSLGLDLFQKMVLKYNRTSGNKVMCLGIIFTMVQNSDYQVETMDKIRERKKFSVFDNVMKLAPIVAKNSEEHKLLLETRGKKTEITKLADEFVSRIDKI